MRMGLWGGRREGDFEVGLILEGGEGGERVWEVSMLL